MHDPDIQRHMIEREGTDGLPDIKEWRRLQSAADGSNLREFSASSC